MPTSQKNVFSHFVAIMDCFTSATPELGVREVARTSGLTPSTAGRLMAALRDTGLLRQNPTSRLYSLGSRVLAWAGAYTSGLDIRNVALPVMVKLLNSSRETISLYTLDGMERVCVERLESPLTVRIVARLGRRLPLYAGSAGKAILAFLPDAEVNAYLAAIQLNPFTSNTFTDPHKLRSELAAIKQRGYAYSFGEWLADAAGVAVPIFGFNGAVLGAISISGPVQRFTNENVAEYGKTLLSLTHEISAAMGYQNSTENLENRS
jgi:DNA-binding IclR family transcriptional regulator